MNEILSQSERMKLAWKTRKEKYGKTGFAQSKEERSEKIRTSILETFKENGNVGLKEYYQKQKDNPCESELERREKIKNAMIGREHTWGDKIAIALQGNKNGEGIICTEEKKHKIIESNKKTVRAQFENGRISWMTGKHHTDETKKILKENHLGSLSSLYIDGRSYEKYPREFFDIRNKIAQLDLNSCVLCYIKEKLHIHHIDGNTKNNDINNLVTLCIKCHMSFHTTRNEEIKNFVISKIKEGVKRRTI